MKKLVFTIILTLFAAVASFAIPVTISSKSITGWTRGTDVKLRIFAGKTFVTSDNNIVMGGASFYQEYTCTVVGSTLTIPAITIDSTTDSSIPTATYQAAFFTSAGKQLDFYVNNYRVPHDLGASLTWTQIITFTLSAPNPPPAGYYTNSQVNAIVAGAVSTVTAQLETDLSSYANSLATAVSTIGATETTLKISTPVSVPASVTVPKNIKLSVVDDGLITVAASQTLTIGNLINPGNRKIFVSSASGAKVLFSKGAVERINLAWWVGNTSGISITDALSEALESANAQQGKIYVPSGVWLSSGAHIIGAGVTIEGDGNFPTAAKSTVITLSSPTTTYLFKIAGDTASVRIRDLVLDGTGTSSKTGLLLEGTYPDTSTDLLVERVTFLNWQYGLDLHALVGAEVWQFSQIKVSHSRFLGYSSGIRANSLNSGFTLESSFFGGSSATNALEIAGIGAMLIQATEFSCGGGWTGGANVMKITGAHGIITFQNSQDENCENFILNEASDVTGTVQLESNLIQSKIQVNESMTMNAINNIMIADAVRVDTGVLFFSNFSGNRLRTDSGTPEDTVTIPANPLRMMNTNNSVITKEETINNTAGAFIQRYPQKFLSVFFQEGSPTVPLLTVGASNQLTSESKVLQRWCRTDTDQECTIWYQATLQNSGDNVGEFLFDGNQTGFISYKFNGPVYAEGAIRGQTAQLTDGATITIDPKNGNHQYVTLGGNRTFAFSTFSSFEQTRADGQRLTLEIIQDGTGSRLCSLTTGSNDQFAFGTDITSITCTTTAAKRDILEVIYSKRARRWMVTNFKKGFE